MCLKAHGESCVGAIYAMLLCNLALARGSSPIVQTSFLVTSTRYILNLWCTLIFNPAPYKCTTRSPGNRRHPTGYALLNR